MSRCHWIGSSCISTKTECDYLNGCIKNGHVSKNLTQYSEPQRYSWGVQKRFLLHSFRSYIQIKVAFSPSHSTLTKGQAVYNISRQAPDMAAPRASITESLVWLDRVVIPESPAPQEDALSRRHRIGVSCTILEAMFRSSSSPSSSSSSSSSSSCVPQLYFWGSTVG